MIQIIASGDSEIYNMGSLKENVIIKMKYISNSDSSPTDFCQIKCNHNHPEISEVVHTGSLKPSL